MLACWVRIERSQGHEAVAHDHEEAAEAVHGASGRLTYSGSESHRPRLPSRGPVPGRFDRLTRDSDSRGRLDTPTDQSAAIAARHTTTVAVIVPSSFECHLKVVEARAMIFTGPRLAHKNRLLPTELVETLRVTCTVWHRRHLDVGVYIILHLCAAKVRL